jgi:FKBP-type peptidyl-prolyl cis-trans isomerase 2
MTPYGQTVIIKEITKTWAKIDANHELAGKELIFDITLKSIDSK